MNALASFVSSSIGRKWIVGLTGLALFGFVTVHMLGNLQVFLGPEAINRYGAFLQGTGELLWVARLGLLVLLVAHVWFTLKLRAESRAARPVGYAVTKRMAATFPARWMALSGLTVLVFLIYHLLHFTVQVPGVNFTGSSFVDLHDEKARHDVYTMMVRGFSVPVVSAFYLLGVGLLAMHLQHGIQSLFQSLGLNTGKTRPVLEKGGVAFAWLIFVGYAAIPVAVLTKILH